MLRLQSATPRNWVQVVEADFGSFLQDHAACERKASATALSLMCHYPDREELVEGMFDLAEEELIHFREVYRQMKKRNVPLGPDRKDPYVRNLLSLTRQGSDAYFMDRLLVSGIIEARGCERFQLLAEGLEDPESRAFYDRLARAEARHHALFVKLALLYFEEDHVRERLEELARSEAEIVGALPLQAVLH